MWEKWSYLPKDLVKMTEMRKQKLVIPKTQENGQKVIFSKKGHGLEGRKRLQNYWLLQMKQIRNFGEWGGACMVHLHFNNHHGILIITSSFFFTYLITLRNDANNHFKCMLNSRTAVELTDNVLNATYHHTIIPNLFPSSYSTCYIS